MYYLVIFMALARKPFTQMPLLLPSLQWLLQGPAPIPLRDAKPGEGGIWGEHMTTKITSKSA